MTMDYRVLYKGEYRIWNEIALRERLAEVYAEQEGPAKGKTVVWCRCKGRNCEIPMHVTSHSPIHHINTHVREDQLKHTIFCTHYHDAEEGEYKNMPAEPFGKLDQDTGIINYSVAWEHVERKQEAESPLYDVHSNSRSVNYRRTTFDALMKVQNALFFGKFQHPDDGRTYDIATFCGKFWGYLNKKITIGKKKLSELKKGEFFLVEVLDAKEERRSYNISVTGVRRKSYYIPTKEVEKAFLKFRADNNEMTMGTALQHKGARILMYGFEDKSQETWKYSELGFMLVNTYGLYCESLLEVDVYNIICDTLFKTDLHKQILFEKPLLPEGIYDDHPAYIPDGYLVDRTSKLRKKIVLEVFGRVEAEYLERKYQKLVSCSEKMLVWDIVEDPQKTYKKIREFCEREKETPLIDF